MNHVTFASPPGWPTFPAGTLPASNWVPAADLPPAPPGWVFYLGAAQEPVAAPPGAWQPVVDTPFVPPAPSSEQPVLAAPVPPTPKKRTGLIIALVAVLGVVALTLAGVVGYALFFAPPQLSPAQFAKITQFKEFAGQKTDWVADKIPGPGGDSEQCKRSAAIFERATASYIGGSVGAVRFDKVTDATDFVSAINECSISQSPGATYEEGVTDGVTWTTTTGPSVFAYGNVLIIARNDGRAELIASCSQATKKLVDGLR